MLKRIFAYGSFSQGQVHHNKIRSLITGQKTAFLSGVAYRLRSGFPGIVPDPSGDLIEGVLYEFEAPDSYWAIVDSLVGFDPAKADRCLFQRQTVEVRVDNFSKFQAECYVLNSKKLISSYKKITGGDWKKDFYKEPPVSLSLESRQKEYVLQLSKTKGRDIVPIKLDLYRELMNLELIVDKGRRLALTPLGKEVVPFLEI